MLSFTCVPCVFMSHFGRDLNQSGDGLPRRFEMLSFLLGCVIGRLKFHYYQLLTLVGIQSRVSINGQEKRRETRDETPKGFRKVCDYSLSQEYPTKPLRKKTAPRSLINLAGKSGNLELNWLAKFVMK